MTRQQLTSVTGIVLAAGRSRRMGRPKQLLRLADDCTVIETVAQRVRPFVHELVVVVGHVGGQVAAVLADSDVVIAVNSHVDRGMLSSAQAGVRQADPSTRGYLFCLGDQPSLRAPVVNAVLDAARGGAGIVLPVFEGRRGHPVFIHCRYRERILALDPDTVGLNEITRGYPADTLEVELSDAMILDDMDTPADYARELERDMRFAADTSPDSNPDSYLGKRPSHG